LDGAPEGQNGPEDLARHTSLGLAGRCREDLGEILRDEQADASDRLVAAELAGDLIVIHDELAETLLVIVRREDPPEPLRARAALSLGPVLEQGETQGFEVPDQMPITPRTFRRITESLRKLYLDGRIPKEVRRRILEASVRAPQDWHPEAIRAAYVSQDKEWRLTAVFAMRWVRGFEDQILEALESADPEIQCEAVRAADNWGLDAAWSQVAALVTSKRTWKPLLLAAIAAVASIRPQQAGGILLGLSDADDEEIAEAASEAMALAEGTWEEDEGGEEDASGWIN
jgi:hypothetical protein